MCKWYLTVAFLLQIGVRWVQSDEHTHKVSLMGTGEDPKMPRIHPANLSFSFFYCSITTRRRWSFGESTFADWHLKSWIFHFFFFFQGWTQWGHTIIGRKLMLTFRCPSALVPSKASTIIMRRWRSKFKVCLLLVWILFVDRYHISK